MSLGTYIRRSALVLAVALIPGCGAGGDSMAPGEVSASNPDSLKGSAASVSPAQGTVAVINTRPGFVCDAPKVAVCHIPPGNPANEHSICVGAPAVEPHRHHHGDTIGAPCLSDLPPPPPPAPQPPPTPDAGTIDPGADAGSIG